MKSIKEITKQIKYENITEFLSKSNFDFTILDNDYIDCLYNVYSPQLFTSQYLYIGNKGTQLYFLQIKQRYHLYENSTNNIYYDYNPNEYFIADKYTVDNICINVESFLHVDILTNKKYTFNNKFKLQLYLYLYASNFEKFLKGQF